MFMQRALSASDESHLQSAQSADCTPDHCGDKQLIPAVDADVAALPGSVPDEEECSPVAHLPVQGAVEEEAVQKAKVEEVQNEAAGEEMELSLSELMKKCPHPLDWPTTCLCDSSLDCDSLNSFGCSFVYFHGHYVLCLDYGFDFVNSFVPFHHVNYANANDFCHHHLIHKLFLLFF